MPGSAAFRVTYARYSELRDDVAQQMARGGLLLRVHDASGLSLDTPVALELVLPDGTTLHSTGKVLQVFAGVGVAVSVQPLLVEQASQCTSRPEIASGTTRHERIDPALSRQPAPHRTRAPDTIPAPHRTPSPDRTPAPARAPALDRTPAPAGTPSAWTAATAPAFGGDAAPADRHRTGEHRLPGPTAVPRAPSGSTSVPQESTAASPGNLAAGPGARPDGPSRNEKIQKALHGNRDERNAILRDRDRTLHPFVLKNPQLDADDVLNIAKNAQMTPDLLKLIGERKDWFQRPAIALALARNPKTPPELAVRALEHVPIEAVRQMAKGGVLPHVTQAARKKLIG